MKTVGRGAVLRCVAVGAECVSRVRTTINEMGKGWEKQQKQGN